MGDGLSRIRLLYWNMHWHYIRRRAATNARGGVSGGACWFLAPSYEDFVRRVHVSCEIVWTLTLLK